MPAICIGNTPVLVEPVDMKVWQQIEAEDAFVYAEHKNPRRWSAIVTVVEETPKDRERNGINAVVSSSINTLTKPLLRPGQVITGITRDQLFEIKQTIC